MKFNFLKILLDNLIRSFFLQEYSVKSKTGNKNEFYNNF